ncbi:MAG: hypothetical protein DRR16_27310 [Candidatus Parabeggiatoa sp. nov. 3]|nr:MAG: hypothetical protein DRR00_16995 [Gammaproteobacteria bacterium]RKZ57618.1 MAG: hypothetical protein DRQ99_26685 [Gammaproteobacteria bacterium]RKZ78637.1 MAG: hypothetical protein DRR16_27310 [Gammaproteobacteria bacterium]HEW97566.1 hypothetical protein [Beggiatoa sp.]
MPTTIYNFEAKSIQNYILDSSKLKDMIGASEQIEYLCCENGLLDQVLQALDFNKETFCFARRAGGAIQAIFSNTDDAKRFQAVWTLCIQHAFPGLTFIQGIAEHEDWKTAIDKSQTAFKQDDRTRLSFTLPLAGPLVTRSRRTGQPAVFYQKQLGEYQDATTKNKRKFRKGERLIGKITFDMPVEWPVNFNPSDQEDENEHLFPLLKDKDNNYINNYIGIIHADGNNFGQLLRQVQDTLLKNPKVTERYYAEVLMAFSQAINHANIQATLEATKQVLAKEATHDFQVMPARPLVLGGDDFTFIVRGDLALPFTQKFLEEFEKRSEDELAQLKKYPELNQDLPTKLTAGAGIAYVKASQPFYRAYHLTESLCTQAKNFAKVHPETRAGKDIIPSSVAFHRITTSIIDDYETVLQHELRHEFGSRKIQATMQPYLVGNVIPSKSPDDCPRLDDLWTLYDFLTKHEISHGVMREFLSLLEIDPRRAEAAMARWYDNMKKRKKTGLLDELKRILATLVDSQPEDAVKLLSASVNDYECTPIGDALALMSINKGSDYV